MKYVRLTGTPDPERTPELFSLLARSSFVDEARLYDWNVSHGERATALLEVDGDRERFRDEVADVPGVVSADTTRVSDGRFTILLVLEPDVVPLLKRMVETISQEGLVVAKPIRYRNGHVHARIVGSTSVLQQAVDEVPAEIHVEISAVGDFDRSHETPMSDLSDRQREALLTAFDLGYYDFPRRATHADVAARLDCAPHTASEHLQSAPHTASEHLQKAEMKILTDVIQRGMEQ
jgi:predicted DNA binding protein